MKQPERLVSCVECGRSGKSNITGSTPRRSKPGFSGHPTCMNLAQIDAAIRSYDWQCNEHKTCNVCGEGEEGVSTCMTVGTRLGLTNGAEPYAHL